MLFITTSIFPIFVFGGIFVHLSNEVYAAISDYLFRAKTNIDFAVSGPMFLPFYLTGLGIISLITLSISSIFVLIKKFKYSRIFLVLTLFGVLARILGVYYLFFQTFVEPKVGEFVFYIIEDLIFLAIVFLLLFWQISILLRILVKSLQRNAIMP